MKPPSSTSRPLPILAVLVLASSAYLFTAVLVIPAFGDIARELDAAPTTVAWLLTAPLIVGAVTPAILGRFGDMFGKARILALERRVRPRAPGRARRLRGGAQPRAQESGAAAVEVVCMTTTGGILHQKRGDTLKRELDIDAFYGALESKKSEQNLSWRKLAQTLEMDHTVFTRMSRGQVPPATTLLTLSGWLGRPLEHFATGEVEAPDARQDTLEAIHSFLRADKALAPESADAIHSVLKAAYAQLAQQDERADEEIESPAVTTAR
jgi:hypothetical protein